MPEPRLAAKNWEIGFEAEIRAHWDREDLYGFRPESGKPVYVIDTPPPYPSGEIHPGQAIGYALIDMIARAQRMWGKEVLFPMGLDRNGINIERTVEKKYRRRLHEWDRAEFIDRCREEITAIGEGILQNFRRMGMTMDFAHTYYTDSNEYRAFSQGVFLDLYRQGLCYRGERPTFYCVACETPLAEADILYEEMPSKLAWIRFGLENGGHVTVATSRPELLPACRTIIVHPDDARWASAVGRIARIPL